jgi:SAM-dependent methyltransferase
MFSWLWRKQWFRREIYNLMGLCFRKKTGWKMMNCGLVPSEPILKNDDVNRQERHSYELYAQLIVRTPLKGRDVLELGSGRGGGACFLLKTQSPQRLVALDYTPGTIRWCRRNFSKPGLEFVCGDAANPPFLEASFDVIVAVELTHCIIDKVAFLAAIARILRPGGRLLIADFFYLRSDAMHALGKFESAVEGSDFTTIAVDDWTAGATAAIEADSERRKADIQRSVPGFLRELSIQFASTTASSTYVAMQAGRTVYRRYVLERSE